MKASLPFFRGIALGVIAAAVTDDWVTCLIVLLALVASFVLTDEQASR